MLLKTTMQCTDRKERGGKIKKREMGGEWNERVREREREKEREGTQRRFIEKVDEKENVLPLKCTTHI